MKRSTGSNLDVAQATANLGAALLASHDLSFEKAWTDANDYILISAWEFALNDESQQWSGKSTATADDEASIEHENCPTENNCEEN